MKPETIEELLACMDSEYACPTEWKDKNLCPDMATCDDCRRAWLEGLEPPIGDVLDSIRCPWPESVWTMTTEEYIAAVPEPLRTRISGYAMREGWNAAMAAV